MWEEDEEIVDASPREHLGVGRHESCFQVSLYFKIKERLELEGFW